MNGAAELDLLRQVGAWISLGTSLACFAFVAAYAALARWWTSYEGRIMMGKAIALGLLALYAFLVVMVIPNSTSLRLARVALTAAIGIFMIFQTAVLIRRQCLRRKRKKELV